MGNRIGDNLVHTGENKELIAALVSQDVRFVIIGGLAISWHFEERVADDLDILIENSEHNDRGMSEVLVQLGLDRPAPGQFLRPGLLMPLKKHFYADILTPRVGAPSFADCYESAAQARLFHIPVRVASVPALIALKEFAATQSLDSHAKHMTDLAILRGSAA